MFRGKRWVVVPVLMLALAGTTACGDDGAGDADLPTGANPAGAGSTAASASGAYAQALAFAKCMRDNGLPDFPDPAPDGSLDAANAGIDRASTQYRNALEACRDLRPGGTGEGGTDPDKVAQMAKYAKCMRENGLPDFPDPGPNGFEPGALDPKKPGFAAAAKACQEFLTWR
jgi:hypothetical protein